MTISDLLESDRPRSQIVELIGYALDDKGADSEFLEDVRWTSTEDKVSKAWWFYGSLLNHHARDILTRIPFQGLAQVLAEMGLPEHSSAVARFDAEFLDSHILECEEGIDAYIREHSLEMDITNGLPRRQNGLIVDLKRKVQMDNPMSAATDDTKACDVCGELTYRFCRDEPDILKYGSSRPEHLVLGYYCPACHTAILESRIADQSPVSSRHSLDSDWRVALPARLAQDNCAYSAERVGIQLSWSYPYLREQSRKRILLGRRVTCPDDARLSLRFTDVQVCGSETFLSTVRAYIMNGCGGTSVLAEITDSEVWVHADVPNRTRVPPQLERLARRFPSRGGHEIYLTLLFSGVATVSL